MTTETKADNVTETNNLSTFKPLGKYAVIAVIMVSIIVTTAIMLDKQFNSAERELATIESEVASLDNTETATLIESNLETKTEKGAMAAVESEVNTTQALPANTPDITSIVAVENTPSNDTQANAVQNDIEQKSNDRITTYKLEQKQRMTDMYARIKTLEAKQLERYKSNQDKQVEQLRTRIAEQEQLIEELITRNNEWFELRTANIQRNQARREDILNRI